MHLILLPPTAAGETSAANTSNVDPMDTTTSDLSGSSSELDLIQKLLNPLTELNILTIENGDAANDQTGNPRFTVRSRVSCDIYALVFIYSPLIHSHYTLP